MGFMDVGQRGEIKENCGRSEKSQIERKVRQKYIEHTYIICQLLNNRGESKTMQRGKVSASAWIHARGLTEGICFRQNR